MVLHYGLKDVKGLANGHRSFDELTVLEKEALVKQIAEKKQGIADKDWSEICDEFDLDVSSETLRKAGTGIKLADDAGMLSLHPFASSDTNETISSLSDGYVDRQKLRDLTKRVNNIFRTESRSELLRECIADAVKDLPKIEIEPLRHATDECREDRCLVVGLGDFHYGADIHVTGLRGEVVNKYNHTMFELRMNTLLGEILDILRKERISRVSIMLVGDLIDGMLRQSQLMRLEYGVIESTIRLSEYLARWIGDLSNYATVSVHAAMGNHSEIRPLKSQSREFEDENVEKIIMWYLHSRLSGQWNIVIDPDCHKHSLVEVEGFSFLILHGDGEKGISQIAQSAINMYGKPIDFFVCGHRHKEQEYPMGMTDSGDSVIIRVPSICGVDRYAQSRWYGGKPGAIAMVIEKGYGRRCVYPIQLK